MSADHDRAFFRSFAIVLGVLVAFAIVFVFVARMIVADSDAFAEIKYARIAERTEPVYAVVTDPSQVQKVAQAGSSNTGGGAPKSGKEVYQSVCSTCHATGVLGAPKIGDVSAWKPRIAKGKNTLYKHAIQGFKAMPPKGGATNLSDAEVKAAVDYMVKKSGGYN